MGQVILFHTDPSAPCPHDREKAARMANLLFCLCVLPSCREARLPYYREVGIEEDEARRLDAEATRIFRLQIESLERPA